MGHYDRETVKQIIDTAIAAGQSSLTAPEGKRVADAYGIPTPGEGLATTAEQAAKLGGDIGFPVVLKIVSPDILHKTEAGGVLVGVSSAHEAAAGFDTIIANANKYKADADIVGVQVQQQLGGGTEVIVGAVTDPTFGKVVAFGLGGVLVEVLKDVTFGLAPTSAEDAMSMVDGIKAAEILRGARGSEPVDR
ncbi:MAG TPA: acetate--CoA ligase family protein, partial [Pseudonocardiaceae bacterium]